MIRHVRPRALALAALLVVAPLPFGSVAPGPATMAPRRGARRPRDRPLDAGHPRCAGSGARVRLPQAAAARARLRRGRSRRDRPARLAAVAAGTRGDHRLGRSRVGSSRAPGRGARRAGAARSRRRPWRSVRRDVARPGREPVGGARLAAAGGRIPRCGLDRRFAPGAAHALRGAPPRGDGAGGDRRRAVDLAVGHPLGSDDPQCGVTPARQLRQPEPSRALPRDRAGGGVRLALVGRAAHGVGGATPAAPRTGCSPSGRRRSRSCCSSAASC